MRQKRITSQELKELRNSLKEHTCYLVRVCYRVSNPMHDAILFMGFKNGGYCELYINSYDNASDLNSIYDIEIIKELHQFK